MSHFYIHIPFCRHACHYCDFHFSTQLRHTDDLCQAICQEITLRNPYKTPAETLYFGGGTPSLLEAPTLTKMMHTLHRRIDLGHVKEQSIEANPEDITPDKLSLWLDLGFNRISLGVQSFCNNTLKTLGRLSNQTQIHKALTLIKQTPLKHLSIDLMYGIPTQSTQTFKTSLNQALGYTPNHLSLYNLSIEPNTILAYKTKHRTYPRVCAKQSAKEMLWASKYLENQGFVHYEISNYAYGDAVSLHNSAYWQRVPYDGFGPSAHSFDGTTRRWNIASNPLYTKALKANKPIHQQETLSATQVQQERWLLGLRTNKGVPWQPLDSMMPSKVRALLPKLQANGLVQHNQGHIRLTKQGWLVADEITQLFF